MVRLVDDLLDVSRITRGKIELRKEPDRPGGGGAARPSRPPGRSSRRRHSPGGAARAAGLAGGRPGRLEQVVANLLNNAAKYTEHGRHASVGGARTDEAVVRVRDNGIGIAPELLPRIFDLFTQADRALDRSLGGLGVSWVRAPAYSAGVRPSRDEWGR